MKLFLKDRLRKLLHFAWTNLCLVRWRQTGERKQKWPFWPFFSFRCFLLHRSTLQGEDKKKTFKLDFPIYFEHKIRNYERLCTVQYLLYDDIITLVFFLFKKNWKWKDCKTFRSHVIIEYFFKRWNYQLYFISFYVTSVKNPFSLKKNLANPLVSIHFL